MTRKELTATYLVQTPMPGEFVAELIAGEQSSGTFMPLAGETDELKARARARVVSIKEKESEIVPLASAWLVRKGLDAQLLHEYQIEIAFPIANFGANLPALCSTVMGNLYELGELTGARLLQLDLQPDYVNRFPGPFHGVQGTRTLAGVHDRPLIGTIVKPSVGLSVEEIAGIVEQLCDAGIDFIKDDELAANPAHAPFKQRVDAVMRVISRHADRTGKRVIYAFNVTDNGSQMLRNAAYLEKRGACCAMINMNWVGIASVEMLRTHTPMAIHAHRAGWGMFTRHPGLGVNYEVIQQLYRLAGADHLHVNGLLSKFWEPDDSVAASARACLDESNGLRAAMPVFSSGQWGGQAGDTFQTVGSTDLMYLAGGGIFAHTLGPAAGVMALQQAWAAAADGLDTENAARLYPEFAASVRQFGGPQSTRAIT